MGSVPSAEGRWPADVTAVEREGAGGPAVSCGALVWRFQRALRVTVLAKATFDLVHEQPMRWRAPDPIARRDAHAADDPARSLRVATDVVPYRPRADVTFVGFAYAPPNGATATTVRLAVYRETKIVERSLHVYGDRDPSGAVRPFQRMELTYERAGASPENPVGARSPNVVDPRGAPHVGSFGPISKYWPPRARLLRGGQPSSEGHLALGDDFDWAFFQAAPPDQRPTFLRGDEWIVLDGLHPTIPRFKTQLPSIAARAVVHRAAQGRLGAGHPLELATDTLAIDGERMIANVGFRASFPIESEEALAALKILVGVTRASRAEPGADPPRRTLPSMVDEEQDDSDETALLPPAAAAPTSRQAPVPLAGTPRDSYPGAPPSKPNPFAASSEMESTFMLSEEESRSLGRPAAPAPPAAPPVDLPIANVAARVALVDEGFEGTMDISPAEMAALAGRPTPIAAAPMRASQPSFVLPRVHSDDDDPDEDLGTSGTGLLDRTELLARADAMPFGQPPSPPPSVPLPPFVEGDATSVIAGARLPSGGIAVPPPPLSSRASFRTTSGPSSARAEPKLARSVPLPPPPPPPPAGDGTSPRPTPAPLELAPTMPPAASPSMPAPPSMVAAPPPHVPGRPKPPPDGDR